VQTVTFYSYKGGTGRSLLLASTARYLALLGYRVVALDLDLEAPSLHYKLDISPAGKRKDKLHPRSGAVDYLLAAAQKEAPPPSLVEFVMRVPLPAKSEGSLQLMAAGSAPTGEYWKALAGLQRQNLFDDSEATGLIACLELLIQIEEELEADFLLIDTRTGVTELGGVTMTVLANTVVCLMLANRESQEGARAVLRSFRHAARLSGQGSIKVVPVLSRVPEGAESLAEQALSFLNESGPTPEDTLALEKVFLLRADSELSFGERLLGSRDPASSSILDQDFLALTTELVEPGPPP
jgi:cellulose biosynthesis protein BcsQ